MKWDVRCCLMPCLALRTLNSLQETYEAKRNEFLGELQKKEEEKRQMFVMRVKEKEAELKEAEKEVSCLSSRSGRWHFLSMLRLVSLHSGTECFPSPVTTRAASPPGKECWQIFLSPFSRW